MAQTAVYIDGGYLKRLLWSMRVKKVLLFVSRMVLNVPIIRICGMLQTNDLNSPRRYFRGFSGIIKRRRPPVTGGPSVILT